MLEPIYLDLHIHTSENADKLNESYDVDCLVKKILEYNQDSSSLISFTDHNVINKQAYEELIGKNEKISVLLGVELHIRNYLEASPYHAHIFFKTESILNEIDNINDILKGLYPKKMVSSNDVIPSINDIVNGFEKYDFLILPHGGQNHSTFEKSIPKGVNFDNTLERTIYYNQFDGFTSRSEKGTQETIDYFKRLNISEFINLVTGTDNYNPQKYPEPKAESNATEFVPTWMLAEPTFNGLRISLSEKNRLKYQMNKPEVSSQFIKSCKLKNDKIDIDVELTSGLNVVIGESSSGKSLFIDSLFRKINNSFEDSVYEDFGVGDIVVKNPHEFLPHYINQNFLVEKINNREINEIDLIKKQFPKDEGTNKEVAARLNELKSIISSLTTSASKLEVLESELKTIPAIGKLIFSGTVDSNPIDPFVITAEVDEKTNFDKTDFEEYIRVLDEIDTLKDINSFMDDVSSEIKVVKTALKKAYDKSKLKGLIKNIADTHKQECSESIESKNGEKATIQLQRDALLEKTRAYIKELKGYHDSLEKLSKFDYKIETTSLERAGNKLFVENKLTITEEKVLDAIAKYLKSKLEVTKVIGIPVQSLYSSNWKKKNPKVSSYKNLADRIYGEFSSMNEENYKIIARGGTDFDSLSPGWKTAVILDLIFANSSDYAPLIIDQPEDNLASTYLNGAFIDSIHRTKQSRQVIVVSHTATIPMLGDAQNVIVCQNKNGKIVIRNAPLEGTIDKKDIVDIVARLTDGGKSSIKKRFKKYNLKKYRGDSDED